MASPFTPPTIPGAQGYPLGLTGVTAATRYVGATASGAPGSGTFAVGDFAIDQSGAVYICTVAGSPGTWSAIGASSTPSTGWIDDSAATWTRTGNQTFTVAGDRTAVFSKGTRLRWTQTTVKYGTVVLSSHAAGTTTVTIALSTDYVLTAAAITVNSYSYVANPEGYPTWFTYTPPLTGSVSDPSLGSAGGFYQSGRFAIVGSAITANIRLTFGTSSPTAGSGVYRIGLPYTIPSGQIYETGGVGFIYDSSAADTWTVVPQLAAGVAYATMTQTQTVTAAQVGAAVPFTWAASDQMALTIAAEI